MGLKTRQVKVGKLLVGGGAPVSVQTMCNVDPHDAKACLGQLLSCAELGCEIFRRRVPDFIVKYASLTFMTLLIGLMGLLILRDSWRSWKIHTYQPAASSSSDSSGSSTTNGTENATGQRR